INDSEKQKLWELNDRKQEQSIQMFEKVLEQSGSSLEKFATDNLGQAAELFYNVLHFKEIRINVLVKHPIYIDLESYIHIYLSYFEEFQVNNPFENKNNFRLNEEVFNLMEEVIDQIEDEYQLFREENPEQRFSKFGKKGFYLEGDYYTFYIEPNGRISTFHKNKPEHEKQKDTV
ncbi:MAG: hypothetical protein H0X62_12030, partial [Bacteroidetes bacterium]|nr:hypothetical protein [Bacteroidota bacterium]